MVRTDAVYVRRGVEMKVVGIILIVMGVLAAGGAMQRGGDLVSYAVPLVLVLLGIGAFAQAKSKRESDEKSPYEKR